eukprot:303803-Rhodomonas_salina.3
MEKNLKVSVRALQGVRFSLIVFLSAHWIGCLFFWLARLRHFQDATWVAGFETRMPLFHRSVSARERKGARGWGWVRELDPSQLVFRTTLLATWQLRVKSLLGPGLQLWEEEFDASFGTLYSICLYRGFNALANIGYDTVLPQTETEIILSVVVMGIQVPLLPSSFRRGRALTWGALGAGAQVYMSALVLGTLLNYLVAKDRLVEAHKKRLEQITQFAEAKGIPSDLREKIFTYLQFQVRARPECEELGSEAREGQTENKSGEERVTR